MKGSADKREVPVEGGAHFDRIAGLSWIMGVGHAHALTVFAILEDLAGTLENTLLNEAAITLNGRIASPLSHCVLNGNAVVKGHAKINDSCQNDDHERGEKGELHQILPPARCHQESHSAHSVLSLSVVAGLVILPRYYNVATAARSA